MAESEWHARSFLIELKPRAEFASLFVDCPPCGDCHPHVAPRTGGEGDSCCAARSELVRLGEREVELRDARGGDAGDCFSARISDIVLQPGSMCALTWADHHRLFMCKVHADSDRTALVPKTFHRLASDIAMGVLLDEYLESVRSQPISLFCGDCCHPLFASSSGRSVELRGMPEDDWLGTAQSMEYFCGDSCGHGHARPSHAVELCSADGHRRWLPTDTALVIAHSFALVLKKLIAADSVNVDSASGVVRCTRCLSELGIALRRNPDVLQLHQTVTDLRVANSRETYLSTRFGSTERYFAWLLLSQCESQTSLKLVIRTYDKRPYLLIWLLESYVVLTRGNLREQQAGERADFVRSFPALKMLYKVFDAESAKSDPRANGEDASVGLVDVPFGCCCQLMEILLASSHALPPVCRSVGQFYVGFLKLKDCLE